MLTSKQPFNILENALVGFFTERITYLRPLLIKYEATVRYKDRLVPLQAKIQDFMRIKKI